jgi:hypothetical protein
MYRVNSNMVNYRHSTVEIQVLHYGQSQHKVKNKLEASTGGKHITAER